jgi:hypothetical protein
MQSLNSAKYIYAYVVSRYLQRIHLLSRNTMFLDKINKPKNEIPPQEKGSLQLCLVFQRTIQFRHWCA